MNEKDNLGESQIRVGGADWIPSGPLYIWCLFQDISPKVGNISVTILLMRLDRALVHIYGGIFMNLYLALYASAGTKMHLFLVIMIRLLVVDLIFLCTMLSWMYEA